MRKVTQMQVIKQVQKRAKAHSGHGDRAKLARKAKLTEASLSRFVSGKQPLNSAAFMRLVYALGGKVEWK